MNNRTKLLICFLALIWGEWLNGRFLQENAFGVAWALTFVPLTLYFGVMEAYEDNKKC